MNAIQVAPDRVGVVTLEPHVKPFALDMSSSNYETSKTLREGNSISQFRSIGPNHYLTAVNRPVALGATLSDPRFYSIIETRISGERPILGAETIEIQEPGRYTVSVGPPTTARSFVIDTYKVSITSHQIGLDVISDDVPVTFVAKTDPPGHEDEITWLSSTRFGLAEPVVGRGPTFTVVFRSTVGFDDSGTLSTWLGVRADNAALIQDQFKSAEVDTCGAISCPETMAYCEFWVKTTNGHADCVPVGLVVGAVFCVGPCPLAAPDDCPLTQIFKYKGCIFIGQRVSTNCQPPCANRFVLK